MGDILNSPGGVHPLIDVIISTRPPDYTRPGQGGRSPPSQISGEETSPVEQGDGDRHVEEGHACVPRALGLAVLRHGGDKLQEEEDEDDDSGGRHF